MSNLLAYGFSQSGNYSVEDRLSDIQSRASSYLSQKEKFKEEIRLLRAMKHQVLEKEREFYSLLGIPNGDYEQVRTKIIQVQKRYDCLLPGGSVITAITNQIEFSGSSISNNQIATKLQGHLNSLLEQEFFQNQTPDQIIKTFKDSGLSPTDFILSQLEKLSMGETGKKTIRTASKLGKIGLGQIVISSLSNRRDFIKALETKSPSLIKVDESGLKKVSPAFKQKIKNELFSKQPSARINVQDFTPEVYRELVNYFITQELKVPGWRGRVNPEQYDLTRNLSSTIGYLGEIRATLIVQDLVPTPKDVAATGNLREAIKHHEIPIDLVYRAYGFQIKNYTLNNDTVEFSHSMTANNWVSDRLQLEGEAADILIDLFGVYQYNQPLATEKHAANLEDYSKLYDSTRKIFDSMKRVYDSRIPYALKIADYFSVDGFSIFQDYGLYFNTFFWIRERLVPSSWILEKLINTLNFNEGVITSSYILEKPDDKGLRYQKLGQKHKKNGLPYTSEDAATRLKVKYKIRINLSELGIW